MGRSTFFASIFPSNPFFGCLSWLLTRECSAGGGGKTKQRQQKILEKNEKLQENRKKRIDKEKAAKEAGAKPQEKQQQKNIEDSVHPSRRGRVPAGY